MWHYMIWWSNLIDFFPSITSSNRFSGCLVVNNKDGGRCFPLDGHAVSTWIPYLWHISNIITPLNSKHLFITNKKNPPCSKIISYKCKHFSCDFPSLRDPFTVISPMDRIIWNKKSLYLFLLPLHINRKSNFMTRFQKHFEKKNFYIQN